MFSGFLRQRRVWSIRQRSVIRFGDAALAFQARQGYATGMRLSREWAGYILGLIGVIIFAGTLPATRLAVAALDPWFVTFGRAAGAGLAAALVLIVLQRPWPGARERKYLLLSAPNIVFSFPALVGFAMQTVPAAHGGVVLGILPLLTAAFGALWNKTRLPRAFWGLSLVAAAVVIAYSLRDGIGHAGMGDLLLFVAALCAAAGYLFSAEAGRTMPGWEVICWICVFCLPITLPLTYVFAPPAIGTVPLTSWAGFAYVALFSQFIGFFAWNAGLVMGGIAAVSQIQYLQTFFTIAFAAIINRETIGWETLAVAGLVVGLLLLGRRVLTRG